MSTFFQLRSTQFPDEPNFRGPCGMSNDVCPCDIPHRPSHIPHAFPPPSPPLRSCDAGSSRRLRTKQTEKRCQKWVASGESTWVADGVRNIASQRSVWYTARIRAMDQKTRRAVELAKHDPQTWSAPETGEKIILTPFPLPLSITY